MDLFALVRKTFYRIQVQFQILRWLTAHALTPILQGLPKSLYLLAGLIGPMLDWLHFLQGTFKFDCSEPAMLPEYVRAV